MERPLSDVRALAFDMFGTVLNLTGTIVPALDGFFRARGEHVDPVGFWTDWRVRQRIEQHQDTILMLGHRGYLDTAGRALRHVLLHRRISHSRSDIMELVRAFERLQPFDDAQEGLLRLGEQYELVALSNGDRALLGHIAENNVEAEFDHVFSVDSVGRFKPHPTVYRAAAAELGREPGEIMMVASHAFDILGARACGYRGAYVDRYHLPYDDSPLVPDLQVADFNELANLLLGR